MAIVQAMLVDQLPDTFGQLAVLLLDKLLCIASAFKATRLDFVGNASEYMAKSIKGIERQRRTASNMQNITLYGSDQKISNQWKKLLASGDNKSRLQQLVAEQWKETRKACQTKIFVAVTDNVYKRMWNSDSEPDASVMEN